MTLLILGSWLLSNAVAAPLHVDVTDEGDGMVLRVEGEPTMVYGMNWGYVPIGTNYGYSLWNEDDTFIQTVLSQEMPLLAGMGANSIRQYPGIPAKWVEYIYDEYGITTMINPTFGRYGLLVEGRWTPNTDYSDPKTRQAILDETMAVVETYKDVRGVSLFLLGNENNYGLGWTSFEIEDLPVGGRDEARARPLYSLWGEAVDAIHAVDTHHPVAICNGDVQYIDLVAELAPNLDIFGTNVYRGYSARDLYQEVEDTLGVPVLYTEFGADAYDAARGREDGVAQGEYLRQQWEDLYLNAAGHGVGNAIGGYVFQWSDGWWKYKQEENLDVHDTNASWENAAYPADHVQGQNNMNEEWFGITSKTAPDPSGLYDIQPRESYYLLQDAWKLDPYAPDSSDAAIRRWFGQFNATSYTPNVAAVNAAASVRQQRAYVHTARIDLSATIAGGSQASGRGPLNPSFDHTQSAYLGLGVRPTDNLDAWATVNVLGNVASNRIDTIFYENRGRRVDAETTEDAVDAVALDRVRLYQAEVNWTGKAFDAHAYFRTGHYHWGDEGDFFGLYQEANYGPSIDTYNADAPIGVTLTGKGALQGVDIAFGPQIWWGANPLIIGKFRRRLSDNLTATLVHHEDIATLPNIASTVAVSEQLTRRTGLSVAWRKGVTTFEAGGLFSGSNKIGQEFLHQRETDSDDSYLDSGYDVLRDKIGIADTFGGRARLTIDGPALSWTTEAAVKGLVADGGYDAPITLTGWTLKPSGRGNVMSAAAGARYNVGSFSIAPRFLAQRPLIGPNNPIADGYEPGSRWYFPQVRARNFRDDPFAVLDNRETLAAEMLIVYDPTPGSWFWLWDSDYREDASFAASLDFVYRHQPTVRDANFGFTQEGFLFAFPGSPQARDEWQVSTRMVFANGKDRVITNVYVGQAQSTGISDRLLTRAGATVQVYRGPWLLDTTVKVNDWGPYDYHRDYNLTFPVQLITDFSGGLGRPSILGNGTRFGMSVKARATDENSEEPPPTDTWGSELELQTYVRVSL
ncbi:MAG: hypothetical protein ACJAZO_005149 [Myxococcota bacterium]|jgi:beta-galactosidase